MIVVAVGYSGTGSSAIIHLLSEYSNFTDGNLGKFEHLPFYTPNGLFDLEDKLLKNNSLYNSDAAVNDFYTAMKRLDREDYGWFGGYHHRFGNRFMEIIDEFISELIDYRAEGFWSYDFKSSFSLIHAVRDLLKICSGKKIGRFGHKVSRKGDGTVIYAFPSEDKFYRAARKFIKNYFAMINPDNNNLIVDQIILPQHLYRIDRYFDEDVKFIVVDRDPRDIYVLTKYVWPTIVNAPKVYPDNPEQFVSLYSKFRNTEQVIESESILRIKFEDLVYQYDDTTHRIEDFLQLSSEDHVRIKKNFNPSQSIKNTQNFKINSEWEREVEPIIKGLPDLIYDFPYQINTSLSETSDP